MKKIMSFAVLVVVFLSLAIPVGNVKAQNIENMNVESMPFSIIEENTILENPNESISPYAAGKLNVGIIERFGGVTGYWKYKGSSTITKVYINMKLNYRKNWLSSWTQYDSVLFSYSGGLGLTEENEKTWYPKKAGQYRACATGTITTINGAYAMTGCSGAVDHDGSTIIARKNEEK